MKKILFLFSLFVAFASSAQSFPDYTIESGGQGRDGQYMVKITTMVSDPNEGYDALSRCSVHGVMFRGFMSPDLSRPSQKPLIKDPTIEQVKADYFNRFFFNEYRTYTNMVEGSYSCIKIKRKQYQVSALFLVDKESLLHQLESAGIVKGFSNLW